MNLYVMVEGSPRVNALPSSSSSTWPEMSNKCNPISLLPHLVSWSHGEWMDNAMPIVRSWKRLGQCNWHRVCHLKVFSCVGLPHFQHSTSPFLHSCAGPCRSPCVIPLRRSFITSLNSNLLLWNPTIHSFNINTNYTACISDIFSLL